MTATTQGTHQYNPLYKPRQLICGSGQTAVVTGWIVKEAIAKTLTPSEYAVIGQLYSPTRGISFLVRNLLANPQARFLVVVNATQEDQNAGGAQCLLDFFRCGFKQGKSDAGRDCWVIESAIPGYIDAEIAASALEKLRQSVECQEAPSIPEAVDQIKSLAQQERTEPWGEPLIYPLVKVEPTVLPGQRYGHRIEGKTIAQTWVKIIHRIKTTGAIRPTAYDGQWQELIDLIAVVTDEPQAFYFPEPNYLPCDRSFIEGYISQFLDDAPQVEGVKYTYGQRLRSWFGRDQVEQVIQKLAADPDSARAVMTLWDVQDDDLGSPPCLNHLWLRVVDNSLSLTATFRSNDMFSAWPANAFGLRALQQHIRDQIAQRSSHDLGMGPLITLSQSAHIYDDCWENADRLIDAQYAKSQPRDYADPSGSFVIQLVNDKIVVEHMTPGSGEVVNCYSGKSASQLYPQIAAACPALEVEHALYLGTELQKAALAVSNPQAWRYEQDKPLKNLIP